MLVMDKGVIVEQGTYEQLRSAGGCFLQLLESNAGERTDGDAMAVSAADVKAEPRPTVAPSPTREKSSGQLTSKEQKAEGTISSAALWFYINQLGGRYLF